MRLIDADALIDKYGDWYAEEGTEEGYIGTIKGIIDSMPTIEPERKTGEWIPVNDRDVPYGLLFKCSECGTEVIVNDALEHNFCSECGCDMRGGKG